MSFSLSTDSRVRLRRLRSAIIERTHGRLVNLSIQCEEDQLVIRGRCESYHVVQLALSAVETAIDQLQVPAPKFEVHVGDRLLTLGNDSDRSARGRSIANGAAVHAPRDSGNTHVHPCCRVCS